METHRQEVGVGALPQLEEVEVPHTVELADMAHMWEVEVVGVRQQGLGGWRGSDTLRLITLAQPLL